MKKLSSHRKNFKERGSESRWKLSYDWFEPDQEGLREALCTLGNGYFGTRGAACESKASGVHYPGTYMAGVYDKLPTRLAGKTIFNEDFVNVPNWLFLTFRIGESEWMTPSSGKILTYKQELDVKRGVLKKIVRVKDIRGRITLIETQRLVHMQDPHRAAIRYCVTPENYEGLIVVRAAIDGNVVNSGVSRYAQLNSLHLKPLKMGTFGKRGVIYLSSKTIQSKIEIAEAARVRLFRNGKEFKPQKHIFKKKKNSICQDFRFFAHKKQRYEIEKIVALYSSRKQSSKYTQGLPYLKRSHSRNPLKAAINSVKDSLRFDSYLSSHEKEWENLWKVFDITTGGDHFSQMVLRLHTFHLLQTASKHNIYIDAGLPARGLHGEAYRGHIFWDGIFIMPFYNLHMPDISRSLLMYRYRRLAAARKYAKKNGYQGAMFPWQSASTGEEETQVIHLNPLSGQWGPDYSSIQRHVSFAVAYNVWQYWKSTGDIDFLSRYGAEIFLSIAHFGSSLLKFSHKDGRFHTYGVMGPDEFHEKLPGSSKPGLKDNAYTNILIAWMLAKSQEILAILPVKARGALLKKIGLSESDVTRWNQMARNIRIIINDKGIISQFDGYFKLKELDWKLYRQKYGVIQRMDRILKAEGKSPDDYKVSKQADVLMIFYLFSLGEVRWLFRTLGYRIDRNIMKRNFDYYLKRTSHGSTLSRVVHCYVAHLLGRNNESRRWFRDVMESDIFDTQGGTAPEGIHAGVMGGSVDIVMRGFAGINVYDDRIKIEPRLPQEWSNLKLNFTHWNRQFVLSITRRYIDIFISGKRSKTIGVPVQIRGKMYSLNIGRHYKIPLKSLKNK